VCLVSQNIDGLLQTKDIGEMKLTMLKQWLHQNNVDVFVCSSELGTCWNLVKYNECLPQKRCGWWEAVPWSLGYNQLEKHPAIYQLGGTGILVTNQLAHHAQKSGDDPMGID